MKKIVIILLLAIGFTSCKKQVSDDTTLPKKKVLYWRVNAIETSGNIISSNIVISRN